MLAIGENGANVEICKSDDNLICFYSINPEIYFAVPRNMNGKTHWDSRGYSFYVEKVIRAEQDVISYFVRVKRKFNVGNKIDEQFVYAIPSGLRYIEVYDKFGLASRLLSTQKDGFGSIK